MRRVPPIYLAAAAALLIGVAVAVAVSIGMREVDAAVRDSGVFEPVLAECNAKSSAVRPAVRRANSRLEREVRGLDLHGVRGEIPAKATPAYLTAIHGRAAAPEEEREQLLFRRLGALEGRAALDEIFDRYGTGYFSAYAMTYALAGWMEVDHEGAMEAFAEMNAPVPNALGLSLQWNGTQMMSGFF